MISPDDRSVSESERIFSPVDLLVLPHRIVFLSDRDSRVNAEPSQNNRQLLDGLIMSS